MQPFQKQQVTDFLKDKREIISYWYRPLVIILKISTYPAQHKTIILVIKHQIKCGSQGRTTTLTDRGQRATGSIHSDEGTGHFGFNLRISRALAPHKKEPLLCFTTQLAYFHTNSRAKRFNAITEDRKSEQQQRNPAVVDFNAQTLL